MKELLILHILTQLGRPRFFGVRFHDAACRALAQRFDLNKSSED